MAFIWKLMITGHSEYGYYLCALYNANADYNDYKDV
jgi:hypothetical protein